MSAMLTWICDECGKVEARDISDDAALDFRVRARYPEGWYVGDERTACTLTTCQAAVQRSDHYLPEAEEQKEDGL